MAPTVPSTRMLVFVTLLSVLIALVWALTTAMLTGLGGSDAAGNGMAQGFTAIAIVLLWLLLGILLLVSFIASPMPWPIVAAALLLLPASGVAVMMALDLLTHRFAPPFLWLIITPA